MLPVIALAKTWPWLSRHGVDQASGGGEEHGVVDSSAGRRCRGPAA